MVERQLPKLDTRVRFPSPALPAERSTKSGRLIARQIFQQLAKGDFL